jgi:hypothetical protein
MDLDGQGSIISEEAVADLIARANCAGIFPTSRISKFQATAGVVGSISR